MQTNRFFVYFFVLGLLLSPTTVNAGWIGFGSYPTITTAQCEAQSGTCRTRAPGMDGCGTGTDRFAGYCDNDGGPGCCVPTEAAITNPQQCADNGGQCVPNDANCFSLNQQAGRGPKFDPIGYCDGAAQKDACCKLGAATGSSGANDYCEQTLKGACVIIASNGPTCTNGKVEVGSCGPDPTTSAPRLCCGTAGPVGGGVTRSGLLNYTLLEEIPNSQNQGGDLVLYLQSLYRFTFWAIGVAALFMLSVGGFLYVTSAGNTSRIETAKTIITDSLLGIVIALFSWLFLYVLNPDLIEGITLPTTSGIIPSSTAPTGTGDTTGPTTVSNDVQTLAQTILTGAAGISLSGGGDCKTATGTAVSPRFTLEQAANGQAVIRCQSGCTGGAACTQTTNLSVAMLQGLIEVAKTYPLTVTSFTGGSHTAASDHYNGAAVDITTGSKPDWPAIVMAFRSKGSNPSRTGCDLGGKTNAVGQKEYLVPSTRCNEANHIHISY